MTTHADKLAAARDAVVEAAKECHDVEAYMSHLDRAVSKLKALEAATCPECGGSGLSNYDEDMRIAVGYPTSPIPCPANCNNGAKP